MGAIEQCEGCGPSDFIYQDREEMILDPKMPNLQKIGTMARLCYRVEPKEGENQRDVDMRVVKHCISSGHESVLEHGIVSVFINPEATEDSKRFGAAFCRDKSPLDFHQLFAFGATDAQMKYIESWMEPELYDKFILREGTNATDKRILPCFVGDVRAWRQVIRERVYIETQAKNKVALALTLKVLFELSRYDDGDVLFGDLVEDINNGLMKSEKFMEIFFPAEACVAPFKDDETLTLQSYCEHVFGSHESVIAGQASPSASVSVILTTDRAMTHQHVRHRKNVAYSQESQRYVNYDKKGIRFINLTMEPSKFQKWCEENGKTLDDIFDDYDLGRVRKDKLGAYYFIPWNSGMVQAAKAYQACVDLKRHWKDAKPETKTDLPQMPPETARGVLPNDTATRIGVTWFRTAGFINFAFWRLEAHAQYVIRATLARMIKKMFQMGHPFCETVPHEVAIHWLEQIKEQNLFKDNTDIDKLIEYRKMIRAHVEKYIKEHAEELKKITQ